MADPRLLWYFMRTPEAIFRSRHSLGSTFHITPVVQPALILLSLGVSSAQVDGCISISQWTGSPSHPLSRPEYPPRRRPIPFKMPIFLQHKVSCELNPYASVETAETVCDE